MLAKSGPKAIVGIEELVDAFKKMHDKRSLYLTGGEPLVNYLDVNDVLSRIRDFDLTIKLGLFTNGTFPSQLDDLISKKLIDFVHIDYKVPLSMEDNTFGLTKLYLSNVEESISTSYRHLKNEEIDYLHLNTVLIDGVHSVGVVEKMIKELPMKAHPFFGIVDYDSPLEYLKRKKFLWYFTRLYQPFDRELLDPGYTEETRRFRDKDLEKVEVLLNRFNKPFKDLFEKNDKFHDKRRDL